MKFIDLFCGIGGFHEALKNEGSTECVFASDIDKHARDAYKQNFGIEPHGDITKISEEEIPEHDILCAGFPCQSFSISGNRKGFEDKRGQLFFDIVRIAKFHKPTILLLENVKGILSADGGDVIFHIRDILYKLGYTVYFNLLNASYYGIPQSRKRVYFVCLRDGVYERPAETYEKIHLEDVLIENEEAKKNVINSTPTKLNTAELKNELETLRIGEFNKGGQACRIYSPKGHAITISSCGGGWGGKTGLYLTKTGIRKLHTEECKACMGFPSSHIVSAGTKGIAQLGNAVIPKMIKKVFKGVRF